MTEKRKIDSEISRAKKLSGKIDRAKDQYALTRIAKEIKSKAWDSYTLSMRIVDELVDRAVLLKHDALRDGLGAIRVPRRRSSERNLEYLDRIAQHGERQLELGQRVAPTERSWRETRRKNPGKKKSSRAKSPSYIKLRSPKVTPDFEHLAWMGSDCRSGRLVEWKLADGEIINVDGRGRPWICLWSPKYKAIVSVRCPAQLRKMMKVDRSLGAAKTFERFMARDAEATYESTVPHVPLVKLGKAEHFVYRSDKWRAKKDTRDYIHDLGKGVKLYAGPSKSRPEIFVCFGGKLTVTERGFVF